MLDARADGRLHPARHPDTQSYVQAIPLTTLTARLSHYRTWGYPLFLRTVGYTAEGWSRVPLVQLVTYLVATLLLWLGVRVWTGSGWMALATAAPLFWAQILELSNLVQPDFLSNAMAVAAVALCFLLAARPSHPVVWVALGAAVFAAYQLRPAKIFLVLAVPVLAWLLRALRRPGGARPSLRWSVAVLSLTFVPYLAFCSLRLALVGQFGVVGFGGYNAAAVATSFLDEELLAELPEEHHDLGRRVLRHRDRGNLEPMRLGDDTELWFRSYNRNLWRVCVAEAWRQLRHQRQVVGTETSGVSPPGRQPPDRIVINRRLGGLASSILRRRPLLYAQWIRDATLYGLRQLPGSPWVVWPAALLAVTLVAVGLLPPRHAGAAPQEPGAGPGGLVRAGVLLALAALLYFLTYTLLVALVSFPFHRYYLSTILFLPSGLVAATWGLWSRRFPILAC